MKSFWCHKRLETKLTLLERFDIKSSQISNAYWDQTIKHHYISFITRIKMFTWFSVINVEIHPVCYLFQIDIVKLASVLEVNKLWKQKKISKVFLEKLKFCAPSFVNII